MSWRPRVLLVARTPTITAKLFGWLTDAGYDVALVGSFEAAKAELRSRPDLLISEVRLAEYNGLHLVSRAQALGIRGVVIGQADPVLERDAHEMGATYVHPDLDRADVLALVERLTGGSSGRHSRSKNDLQPATLAFVSSSDFESGFGSERTASRGTTRRFR